jgi:hypothetical protein
MKNDPFASLGALDQKLFQSRKAPPASRPPVQRRPAQSDEPRETKEPWKQVSKESSNQESLPARNLGTPESSRLAMAGESAVLSLNQRPDRQNTYAFTTTELERLEDAKIAITRRYDLSITKNDLVRCAVQMLLDDYESHGERSAVLKRLRAKKAR